MKIEYRSNKLKKQLDNASEIKRAFGVNAKRVSARMDDIQASPNLAVLMQIPQLTVTSLPGTEKANGQWISPPTTV